MWVPVAVWQPCELLYTCYLLTHLPALGSRYITNKASVAQYLVENTVEVISLDGHELAVGNLRTQHATVKADRVLSTRYRQTETIQNITSSHHHFSRRCNVMRLCDRRSVASMCLQCFDVVGWAAYMVAYIIIANVYAIFRISNATIDCQLAFNVWWFFT